MTVSVRDDIRDQQPTTPTAATGHEPRAKRDALNDPLRDPTRRVAPMTATATPMSADYEYRVISLPRGTSRSDARRLLTEHAEYGRWELARVQISFGGARRVWLRRRIIRVERTLTS
jgi:hypothetical protein